MRIAWLSFDFTEYSIPHVNEMAREHDVLALLPGNQVPGIDKLLSPKVRYPGFHKPRFRQPIQQTRMIRAIVRELRSFSPDVVHFQQGHLYFNWALPLLRKYPLVLTIHDPRFHPGDKDSSKTPQWVMDYGFRRADRVIVHGSDLPEIVHQEIGIPKDKIHVIPHIAIGLPDELNRSNGRTQQPATGRDDEQRVLFFGRIWEYKGLEYLIRAQPVICQRFPNAKIVIGGRGDDFEKYRALMADPERFEVHNDWIDNAQRGKLFANSDIVVLPYIEATQSGVVPIAYANRKPVIATRVGGLPDVVDHGVTGLLVPPRNVEQLARAIIELLEDPLRRQQMGLAGRAKLERENGPAVVVQKTLAVYRHAIQDRGRSLCAVL